MRSNEIRMCPNGTRSDGENEKIFLLFVLFGQKLHTQFDIIGLFSTSKMISILLVDFIKKKQKKKKEQKLKLKAKEMQKILVFLLDSRSTNKINYPF